MLNLLFRIFLAVTALVVVVCLIGSWLPRDFQSSATVVIQGTPGEVFPLVADLRRWQTWSPWNAREIPDLAVEFFDQTQGVGATQKWVEPRGEGKLWITEVNEPDFIAFSSRFANFPQMDSRIELKPVGDSTTVTWQSSGSLPGGPFYGWFGMSFSSALEAEYDKSLDRLKQAVERTRSNP